MFEFSIVDHLRLTFGQIVYRHQAHTRLAHSRARLSRWLRGVEALLIVGVAFGSVAAAFGRSQNYAIVAAVLSGLALLTLVIQLTFDLDGSARTHGAVATRLWHIRERYRALLSDVSDGVFTLDAARNRRDALVDELHAIYDDAPPADHQAYQTAGKAILSGEEKALPDEEIDRFLPASLHKTTKSTAA